MLSKQRGFPQSLEINTTIRPWPPHSKPSAVHSRTCCVTTYRIKPTPHPQNGKLRVVFEFMFSQLYCFYSVTSVRKRTVPIEPPPLVSEVSAHFAWSAQRIPTATISNLILWHVKSCSLVYDQRCFRTTYRLHLHRRTISQSWNQKDCDDPDDGSSPSETSMAS
jgi:hypothetical protein